MGQRRAKSAGIHASWRAESASGGSGGGTSGRTLEGMIGGDACIRLRLPLGALALHGRIPLYGHGTITECWGHSSLPPSGPRVLGSLLSSAVRSLVQMVESVTLPDRICLAGSEGFIMCMFRSSDWIRSSPIDNRQLGCMKAMAIGSNRFKTQATAVTRLTTSG